MPTTPRSGRRSPASPRTTGTWICWSTTSRPFRRMPPHRLPSGPSAWRRPTRSPSGCGRQTSPPTFAAPLLMASDRALVVDMSYYGSVSYHLDPAYGATKAGLDKMTWDMAQDFREQGVAVASVWPGPTSTERSMALSPQLGDGQDRTNTSETPAFTGRVVAALYETPTSSGAPTKS